MPIPKFAVAFPPRRKHLLALVCILVALIVPSSSAAARAPRRGILPPQHPASNISPKPNFTLTCRSNALDNSPTCATAIVRAIDAARAVEHVAPLQFSLSRFLRLAGAVQLFVITDLERSARGLPVITTLSGRLDNLALIGARHATDPEITSGQWVLPGGAQIVDWGSNWAGNTPNGLASDYFWMYADGPGSSNFACPASGAGSGCWAHRFNILGSYPKSAADCDGNPVQRSMGAAVTLVGAHGEPWITELFVAACGNPLAGVVTTWTAVQRTLAH